MYIQNDPRRWKERADGSMVMEDHRAAANLSPDVMMREIPHHEMASDPSLAPRLLVEDRANVASLTMAFMGKVKAGRRL